MKRPLFFDDMHVYSDDLNFLNSSKEEEFTNRFQSLLTSSGGIYGNTTFNTSSVPQGGVFGSPADYTLYQNLKVLEVDPDLVVIYQGKALDENGELIEVPSFLSIQKGNSSDTYSWTSSPNVTNYIKIEYAEIESEPQTDDEGNSHYTRYDPSYFIEIDDTPPLSDQILLATFDANASGEITGSFIRDRRLYIRPIVPASGVILDPTTKPVNAHVSAEDHINAVGSGTPTITNPHGLTAADIGFDNTTVPHIISSHTSGIIATDGEYDSDVYNSFEPSLDDSNPADIVIDFTSPAANAAILVGGIIYDNAISQISLQDTSIFSEGDGAYTVYMDENGDINATSSIPITTADMFVLCTLIRSSSGTVATSFTDARTFRATVQSNIRADVIEATSSSAPSSTDTLLKNLQRIRYYLGRAIGGASGVWNTANPPLTAGYLSNADVYHYHTRTASNTYTINHDAATGDAETMTLRFYRGALHGNACLQWTHDYDVFKMFSSESGGIFAHLHVNTLSARGGKVFFAGDDTITDMDAPLGLPSLRYSSNILSYYSDDDTGTFGDFRAGVLQVWSQGGVNDDPTIIFGVNDRRIQHYHGTAGNRGFRFLASDSEGDWEDIYANRIHAVGGLAGVFDKVTSFPTQDGDDVVAVQNTGSMPIQMSLNVAMGVDLYSASANIALVIYNINPTGSMAIVDRIGWSTSTTLRYFTLKGIIPPGWTGAAWYNNGGWHQNAISADSNSAVDVTLLRHDNIAFNT